MQQLQTAPLPPVVVQAIALEIIGHEGSPARLRIAALPFAKAALFRPDSMRVLRPTYLMALRSAAQSDDETLRARAFGMLAREQDEWALEQLKTGLANPNEAKVSTAKAIQLLSYQVKSDVYPMLRAIAAERDAEDPEPRRAALRVLAADAASRDIFEQVVRDKSDDPEARRIAAGGLHSLDRPAMQAIAKDIALDEGDHDDVRAASFTLLAQHDDDDEALTKQAEASRGGDNAVGRSATAYLNRRRG